MIKTGRWISDCGCAVCYTCDDSLPLAQIFTRDIAYTPCRIHDPVNVGKTLLADDISQLDESRVRQALLADARADDIRARVRGATAIVSVPAAAKRPKTNRQNIPMAETVAIRAESHLREDAKSILINMPEFGRDGKNGREWLFGEPVGTFDADRRLTIDLPGVPATSRVKAADAIQGAAVGDSRLALVSVRR